MRPAFTPWSRSRISDRRKVLSFVLAGEHSIDEHVCCLAANLSCTRLPWSAFIGVAASLLGRGSLPPLLEPTNCAPGLVSNAFRRNAARGFGLHATPASFLTVSSRGWFVIGASAQPVASTSLSSSAPAIRRPLPLAWRLRRARVAPANLTKTRFYPAVASAAPFLASSGLWAILGLIATPEAVRESSRFSPGISSAPLFEAPTLPRTSRPQLHLESLPRHFLRVRPFKPHGSRAGYGPCPASGKTQRLRLVVRLPCALFSRRLPSGRCCTAPTFVLSHEHRQFYPSWLRASSGMTQPHSLSRL